MGVVILVDLEVPYFSQEDNSIDPDGTCGSTSSAMCLKHFGVPGFDNLPQFEDAVKKKFDLLRLSHHSVDGIRRFLESQGLRDDVTTSGGLSDITRALDNGQVCILHGYFTGSGHILVVRGYTDTGDFIVNDPAGEWFYGGYSYNSRSGPDTRGKGKVYSRRLIAAAGNSYSLRQTLNFYDTWDTGTINSAKDMWLHRVSTW